MKLLKIIALWVMVAGYLLAGCNHFYNPQSYWRIIPGYIPIPHTINILAGGFELLFGLLLIFRQTRVLAAGGIILMLIAFLPVHIDMVIRAPFMLGTSLLVTPLIAWVRLVFLQPLLIFWAWWVRRV